MRISFTDQIISNFTPNTYYINILDGDCCHSSKNKFEYLLEKAQNQNVFIGDTVEFYKWYKNTIKTRFPFKTFQISNLNLNLNL